jgi:hypothetical protein
MVIGMGCPGYCAMLPCTVMYCIVLHCTVHSTVLHLIELFLTFLAQTYCWVCDRRRRSLTLETH